MIELAQGSGQDQVALGSEEFLDHRIRRGEEDGAARLHEGVAERAGDVRLARPRQSERQDIEALIDKLPASQLLQLACQD